AIAELLQDASKTLSGKVLAHHPGVRSRLARAADRHQTLVPQLGCLAHQLTEALQLLRPTGKALRQDFQDDGFLRLLIAGQENGLVIVSIEQFVEPKVAENVADQLAEPFGRQSRQWATDRFRFLFRCAL